MTKRYILELTEEEIGSVRSLLSVAFDSGDIIAQEGDWKSASTETKRSHRAVGRVVEKIDAARKIGKTDKQLLLFSLAEAKALSKAADNTLNDGGDFLRDWYTSPAERKAAIRAWRAISIAANEKAPL